MTESPVFGKLVVPGIVPNERELILGSPSAYLGDWWATCQYACYLQRHCRKQVRLYPCSHGWVSDKPLPVQPCWGNQTRLVQEILGVLNSHAAIEVVVDHVPLSEVYWFQGGPILKGSCRTPTRTRWSPAACSSPPSLVYQLDGRSEAARKNPPAEDVARLLNVAVSYQMVALGRHRSIAECVELAARADLYFGVDSGMAQLAYDVGTPAFLLTYRQDPDCLRNWHGGGPAIWCRDTDDFLFKARLFLGLQGTTNNSPCSPSREV